MKTGALERVVDYILLFIIIVVAWQSLAWYGSNTSFASPLATLRVLVQQLYSPVFWEHVQASLEALWLSVVLGVGGGLAIGIVLGLTKRLGRVLEPILVSLYSLPKITLYPLVLLTFGLGISAKVAYGVMHGIIPVILVTVTSLQQIKPIYFRTARVLHVSPLKLVRTIVVPATLPDLVLALRLGFSLSLLGVLIGEMFASKRGLGFLVMNAVEFNNVPLVMSVIIVLFTFALGVNGILLWWSRRFARQ